MNDDRQCINEEIQLWEAQIYVIDTHLELDIYDDKMIECFHILRNELTQKIEKIKRQNDI